MKSFFVKDKTSDLFCTLETRAFKAKILFWPKMGMTCGYLFQLHMINKYLLYIHGGLLCTDVSVNIVGAEFRRTNVRVIGCIMIILQIMVS